MTKNSLNEVSTKNIVNASTISFTILLTISIGSALYLDYSNPGTYPFTAAFKKKRELMPDKEVDRLKTDIVNLCESLYHFNHSMPANPDEKALYRYDLFQKLLNSELILFRMDLEKRFEAFRYIYPVQSLYILPYLNSLIVPISTFIFTILLFYIFYEVQKWLSNPKSNITSYHRLVIGMALVANLIALISGPMVLIPNVDEKMNLGDISVERCLETLYDTENGGFESKFDMIDLVHSLT